MGSFFEFCRGSAQLLGQIKPRQLLNQGRKVSKSGAVKVTSFYDVMEAGTEYLATLSSDQRKVFKPKTFTSYMLVFMLLFALFSSLLSLIVLWFEVSFCNGKAFQGTDHYCSRTIFFTIFELGGIIRFVGTMLMFGNITSGFAALLYGADVANALTRHWLHRFSPFRTITVENDESIKSNDADEVEIDMATERVGNRKRGGKSAVDQVKLVDFQPMIRRDAFERYLFTNYYMESASTIWSTYLVLMIVTNVLLFLYEYFLIAWEISKYGSPSFGLVLSCVINLFMTMFVMGCVSYANSAVDKIKNSFVYAAYDDYSIFSIGEENGRRLWIDYVTEAPVYWYVFGFALTRAWLGAFIGGGVSSIAGVALVVIFGFD
jgi:hypothetical protein